MEKPLDSSSSNGNAEKQSEGKQDTTKEGETESLLSPLPQGSPSKLAPNNRSATLQSNYSSSSKRKTFKKTAINAMLMDAADSDDETPLKYQISKSGKSGKSQETDGTLKYIEFLSRFCKQCKKKKTMYQSMGRLLRRVDIFALLVPIFIFACIVSVIPLLIGYSELAGGKSNCGGSKPMIVVTTLFGILTLSWLALREALGLSKMSHDYERMAQNYSHLANHIRSVQVQLQSEISEASIELLLHHLDKFHQQVRAERDNLTKAPRWIKKRFTTLIVEEEREREMYEGGLGFD